MTGGILVADSAVFTGVATPVFPTSTSGPEASFPEPRGIIRHFSRTNTWRDGARSGLGGANSGRYWARTSDLRLVEAALSQLS